MKNHYYITTPIYYVNDKPHIGHAYTSIIADILSRYMNLDGKETLLLTGTDEHGLKVEKSAKKNNISTQDFVDRTSKDFQELMHICNINNNDFIRTSEKRHKDSIKIIWNQLYNNGDIYLDKYKGWYSIRDEAFYQESELTEEGLAPTGSKVEWVEEKSYFFRLSKYQDKLLEFYETNPDFVYPKSRLNEVINFVKSGLHDLSISRTSFNWGIKVPSDENHVIYVWLDALFNYISALDYSTNKEKYRKFWPANLHVVGKDILRFHAVYWPAFLMSLNMELPKKIIAHGWWTNEGEKISKSLGNTIDPKEIINKYGLDPIRYFLIKEIGFANDGNFSIDNLIQRNNTELANKVGNLSQRVISFIHKHCKGEVPEHNNIYNESILKNLEGKVKDIKNEIEGFNFHKALEKILDLSSDGNIYIDHIAPWKLIKTDINAMNYHLSVILELIRYIGILLQAFIPDSACKILDQLNISDNNRKFINLSKEYAIKPKTRLNKAEVIFQKIK